MSAAREIKVGSADEFADPGRKVIECDGIEIGVFRFNGAFTAFENVCPHLGGPVCQGKMLPRAIEEIGADMKSLGMGFSSEQVNIVCPWHGYEYDVRTGRHQGNERMRLRPFKVRVEDGEVIVAVPERG